MKVSLNRAMAVTALVLALFAAIRSQTQTQTQRTQLIQNDEVKVWRSLVLPNSPLTMHRHDHGRVIIPLQGGTMNIVDQAAPKKATSGRQAKRTGSPPTRPTPCTPTSTPETSQSKSS
jgi:hypothetical protein